MPRRPVLYLIVLLPLSSASAAERGDTTRICLGPTTVEAAVGSAATAASAVREAFTSFLAGPSIGVTPLSARLQSQAREEARQASCRYVLLTTMKHEQKHGSGFMRRMMGSAAQQGAWAVGTSAGSGAGRVLAPGTSTRSRLPRRAESRDRTRRPRPRPLPRPSLGARLASPGSTAAFVPSRTATASHRVIGGIRPT